MIIGTSMLSCSNNNMNDQLNYNFHPSNCTNNIHFLFQQFYFCSVLKIVLQCLLYAIID